MRRLDRDPDRGAVLGDRHPAVDGGAGAAEVAVGCPFCRIMIGDGMVARQSDIEVLDVAQVLLRNVKQQ